MPKNSSKAGDNSNQSLKLIAANAIDKESETDLSEIEQNLLRFCRLLVDIEYERKYGKPLDKDNTNAYSEVTI
jgi:hypothetical protein